jgi:hypothetical protein
VAFDVGVGVVSDVEDDLDDGGVGSTWVGMGV